MQAHLCARILFLIMSTEESLSKKNNTAHHQHMNAHKDISLQLSQSTAKKRIADY